METFHVMVEPFSYIFMIFGADDADNDLVWSDTAPVGLAPGAIGLGVPPAHVTEVVPARFVVSETYERWDDAFLAHSIQVGEAGIEVNEAVASDRPGEKGVVGLIFALPWTGLTTLQFRAPESFVADGDGKAVATALEILVTPAPDGHETYIADLSEVEKDLYDPQFELRKAHEAAEDDEPS